MEIKEKYQKMTDQPKEMVSAQVENERPTIVSKPRAKAFEKGRNENIAN